ncbi:MAG: D-alanine--poly(phosphoribitol) ligase subunit 2 [Bacillota bacterium]|jgi:D-alanine--poly(phosphoribitol) ligase subunit 2|uniref:D-alanyl carrier protein n=1 Tax=Thermanaerosceptrum fracticalcis TaxID=1712410 RepID=A0A7G6E7C9_THEFR|nr:D-alanine--poly(phosphoribitol) ligase subunit 2 [Thermanaerosceptrum fracticalcis]MBZ4654445.1 D-alanine--poly(phosphoribitol) ligase [Peptococcaceae bacterium]QNB47983.1 D-alanine--poly(phosphoribitol) ligase subunit 2 [Thermanaerosceptrum fracticalcis]
MREKILDILCQVCGSEEIRENPDVELYETGLLDSFGTVQLLVAIEEELHMAIPISEIDREMWATPHKIIKFIEERR